MSRMVVHYDKCDLCGKCIESCPFTGVERKDGRIVFTDACRLCRICVKNCPKEAIYLERGKISASDKEKYKGVMVFVEQRDGRIQPVVYELIGKGRELADKLGHELYALFPGSGIAEAAEDLLYYGVDKVYLYDYPELKDYKAESYTAVVEDAAQKLNPNIILMGATPIGRSLAPRVATRLRTGLTADCTLLEVRENGDLIQTRPAFGGNVMAQIITPNHRPQMATVRWKVMAPAERRAEKQGEIVKAKINPNKLASRITVLGVEKNPVVESITDAEIIVAAGRGIGKREGLELLEEFAECLGGVVGVTRPLVEKGWASYNAQIGMSGRTVRPKLYIACGISGAIQHIAGMKGSDIIFAINTDKNAPIFNVAHYGIIGDIYEVIPELMKRIKEEGAEDAIFQVG